MKEPEMQNTAFQRNISAQGANSGVILFFGSTPEFAPRQMLLNAFCCISIKQKTPVNVIFTGVCFDLLFEKVELAGVEPASKRGSNMLSTCLSPDLVFE